MIWMFTPSIIFLMMANTIAASGAAVVALQASLQKPAGLAAERSAIS